MAKFSADAQLVYKSPHGDIPIELDEEMPKDWIVFANSTTGNYKALNIETGRILGGNINDMKYDELRNSTQEEGIEHEIAIGSPSRGLTKEELDKVNRDFAVYARNVHAPTYANFDVMRQTGIKPLTFWQKFKKWTEF